MEGAGACEEAAACDGLLEPADAQSPAGGPAVEGAQDVRPGFAADGQDVLVQLYGTVFKQLEQAVGSEDSSTWRELQDLASDFTERYWLGIDAVEVRLHIDTLLRFGLGHGLMVGG